VMILISLWYAIQAAIVLSIVLAVLFGELGTILYAMYLLVFLLILPMIPLAGIIGLILGMVTVIEFRHIVNANYYREHINRWVMGLPFVFGSLAYGLVIITSEGTTIETLAIITLAIALYTFICTRAGKAAINWYADIMENETN